LPYVLPCKYCRASLSEYIISDPVDCAVRDQRLPRWLWRIHNKVNEKLRGQGIPTTPDPPFEEVAELYLGHLSRGCSRTTFEGWEFLFSIAETHPHSRLVAASTPIEGHPLSTQGLTLLQKNRWNLLSAEERMGKIRRFWEVLPKVLPFPEWRKAWTQGARGASWESRASSLNSLWAIRCSLESQLELLNQTTYSSLCQELREFRSGCSSSRRGKTCRKKRQAN
jgi:hypothetical protein